MEKERKEDGMEGKGREERMLSTKTTSKDESNQEIPAKKKRGEVTL